MSVTQAYASKIENQEKITKAIAEKWLFTDDKNYTP